MTKTAFLSNAKEYVGPGTIQAMTAKGWTVFCHDDSFGKRESRENFERENPGCFASARLSPEEFIEEGLSRFNSIDALISNDIPKKVDFAESARDSMSFFEEQIDSLLMAPMRLLRAALPSMREARSGSVVLITSGSPLCNPSTGPSLGYDAARSGTNTLTKNLAKELAPLGIQVNAVAPFYIFNSTWFPSEIGPEDPKYAKMLERMVPMKRFGLQHEIGQLIYLLAAGDAKFISGQIVAFSGAGC